jgi:hypothetical protein
LSGIRIFDGYGDDGEDAAIDQALSGNCAGDAGDEYQHSRGTGGIAAGQDLDWLPGECQVGMVAGECFLATIAVEYGESPVCLDIARVAAGRSCELSQKQEFVSAFLDGKDIIPGQSHDGGGTFKRVRSCHCCYALRRETRREARAWFHPRDSDGEGAMLRAGDYRDMCLEQGFCRPDVQMPPAAGKAIRVLGWTWQAAL